MKILKHIPNTITSMNVLCGVLGLIAAFNGNNHIAFYFMLAGAVCDFCDGLAARALNAYSPVGKELDSLADLITFGLLPSIMLYKCMEWYHPGQWYCYVPLIIVVFSALRLAKFNVDERQSENFLGLPTPACAMWCGALIYAADNGVMSGVHMLHNPYFIPAVSVVLAFLLISEIPMLSIKFKKGSEYNSVRITFIVICAVFAAASLILKLHWSFILLLVFTLYILHNLIRFLLAKISKK